MPGVFVLADVGGTHVRWAVCDAATPFNSRSMGKISWASVPEGQSESRLAERFLPQLILKLAQPSVGGSRVVGVACGIAGTQSPDGSITMVNRRLSARLDDFKVIFGAPALLFNDLEAMAHGTATLWQEVNWLAGPLKPLPHNQRFVVIGLGTGFGLAIGTPERIDATESGHALHAFVSHKDAGPLTVEDIFSGPGLEKFHHLVTGQVRAAADITAPRPDDDATRDLFETWLVELASEIRDVSARTLASRIVLLGGVIQHLPLDRLGDALKQSFARHSPIKQFLNHVSVGTLLSPEVAFRGLHQKLQEMLSLP